MADKGKVLSIKNDSKINYTAREIGDFIHRGSASVEKIESTLKMIKEEAGIRTLKDLKQEQIAAIAETLKDKVEAGQMSTSTANSYISSINNIVKYVGNSGPDLQAIKASEYGISRDISAKDNINKENTREAAEAFKTWLDEKYKATGDIRYEAVKHQVSIQSVNLRERESRQIKLLEKDLSKNTLKINAKGDGAKNSRPREIKINSEQKAALLEARGFLKANDLKNLNFGTLKEGRSFSYNALNEYKKETGSGFHYHGERHFIAHENYRKGWETKGYNNIECRARTGETKEAWQARILNETGLSKAEFKKIDDEIRLSISNDLGHNRISITSRYLG